MVWHFASRCVLWPICFFPLEISDPAEGGRRNGLKRFFFFFLLHVLPPADFHRWLVTFWPRRCCPEPPPLPPPPPPVLPSLVSVAIDGRRSTSEVQLAK